MIEKKLRGYILPNILATTGTSCYVLADTFFISMAEGANGITGLNLVLPIFAITFAPNIIAAFNNENSKVLADYAIRGIRIYFIGFLPAAFNIITAGFYSAIGRGKESSIIAISRGIAAIIVFAIILSQIFGIVGVWSSFFAAEMFTAIVCIILMRKAF